MANTPARHSRRLVHHFRGYNLHFLLQTGHRTHLAAGEGSSKASRYGRRDVRLLLLSDTSKEIVFTIDVAQAFLALPESLEEVLHTPPQPPSLLVGV